MKSRISLLFLILLIACDKNEDVLNDTSDLWMYADRFFEEAAARNVVLDKSNLTIRYVDASEISPYAGYTTKSPDPLIRIARTRWAQLTETQKEILMFHELGHGMLDRMHTNEMLPDCSSYKSMMNDANANIQLNIYTATATTPRQYYVDELFDPFTAYPSWGGTIPPTITDVSLDPSTFTYVQIGQANHEGNIEEDGSFHISGRSGGEGSSYWFLPVPSDQFPPGTTLMLSFKVKALIIARGAGVSVKLDGILAQGTTFNTSTAYYGPIIDPEMSDFLPITLKLNCYPVSKPEMVVYLALDGLSSGDVWFKDIELSYYHD